MKKRLTFTTILGVLAGLMALTNPDKQDYVIERTRYIQAKICEGFPHHAKTICERTSPATELLIDRHTRHQNYILFSVYHTEVLCIKHRSIGLGDRFFQF